MHILMDLVVNHCSDEHEWFRRRARILTENMANTFILQGRLPCNPRAPLPGHPDKCYLHVFHKKQPDLNWEKLREEIYTMINWWLEGPCRLPHRRHHQHQKGTSV